LRIDFTGHRQHTGAALKIFDSLLGRVAELAIDHDVAKIEAEPFLNECDDVAAPSAAIRIVDMEQRFLRGDTDADDGAAGEKGHEGSWNRDDKREMRNGCHHSTFSHERLHNRPLHARR